MLLRFALLFVCALACRAEMVHRDRWISVADRLLKTPPERYPFNWGEGVQMIGLAKIFESTKNPAYADYLEKWAALYAEKDPDELLGFKTKRPGYCGHWSPGAALLYLHQARPKPEYMRMARMVLDFIRVRAERGPEGGLGHWIGSHQLWVDTVYMAAPVLAGFGKLDRQPEYIDDAARQIAVQARRLQDNTTGLFYHMWDWKTGERTAGLWGRGNGWIFMSLADTFEALDRRHPAYKELQRIAVRMAAGLAKTQDAEGMWHTVMDDRQTYPESSATAMCVYSYLKLIRLKVLPASYRKPAMRAWSAINDRYVKDGLVTGVSAGTGPQKKNSYGQIRIGSETWGTGAYLMAGSEVNRLR
jgi:unsaturated rhamnogalacturonyl hydrolase